MLPLVVVVILQVVVVVNVVVLSLDSRISAVVEFAYNWTERCRRWQATQLDVPHATIWCISQAPAATSLISVQGLGRREGLTDAGYCQ